MLYNIKIQNFNNNNIWFIIYYIL